MREAAEGRHPAAEGADFNAMAAQVEADGKAQSCRSGSARSISSERRHRALQPCVGQLGRHIILPAQQPLVGAFKARQPAKRNPKIQRRHSSPWHRRPPSRSGICVTHVSERLLPISPVRTPTRGRAIAFECPDWLIACAAQRDCLNRAARIQVPSDCHSRSHLRPDLIRPSAALGTAQLLRFAPPLPLPLKVVS